MYTLNPNPVLRFRYFLDPKRTFSLNATFEKKQSWCCLCFCFLLNHFVLGFWLKCKQFLSNDIIRAHTHTTHITSKAIFICPPFFSMRVSAMVDIRFRIEIAHRTFVVFSKWSQWNCFLKKCLIPISQYFHLFLFNAFSEIIKISTFKCTYNLCEIFVHI